MTTTYYSFQHRVTDPSGQTLFLTFQGKDKTPTLELGNNGAPTDAQLWVVSQNGPGKTMIQSKGDTSLQVAPDAKYEKLTVQINGGNVWTKVDNLNGGFTMQIDHNGENVAWHVTSVIAGAEVVLEACSGVCGLLEHWIIVKN